MAASPAAAILGDACFVSSSTMRAELDRTVRTISDLQNVSSPKIKNIPLFRSVKSGVFLLPSPAHQKGVRDRHERRAGDAMDAAVSRTNGAAAYGQVVWSWRRDRGVKFLSFSAAT